MGEWYQGAKFPASTTGSQGACIVRQDARLTETIRALGCVREPLGLAPLLLLGSSAGNEASQYR